MVSLILADLALFEALLIAAATTENLGFGDVRQAMAQSASPSLYLSMVLVGFALKAGVWPLHFWLPLGEITSPDLGLIIQGLGVVAMLYAVVAGLMRSQLKMLPAYAAIVATGLFVTVLGAGLADPAVWNRYGNLAHFFIVSLGFGLASLIIGIGWLEARKPYSDAPAKRADDSNPWFERWPDAVVCWAAQTGFDTLPRLRDSWLAKVGRLWQVRAWQRILDGGERSLQRWTFAITLFLLLGIVVAFVGASFWN